MHQRYSHCGGYDRRTLPHIDHLQERQKMANPQTAIDRPRIERQACTQVRRMRTANLPPAQRQLQAKERRNVGHSFSGGTAAAGGSLSACHALGPG